MLTSCTNSETSFIISSRCLLKVICIYLFCININSSSNLLDIHWSLDIYHHNLMTDVTFSTSSNQNKMPISIDHPYFNSNTTEQTRRTLLTLSDRRDIRNHLNNKRAYIAKNITGSNEAPTPTASNMNFLFWDTAAESVSQTFTDQCINKPIENLMTKFIDSHDYYFQNNPDDYFNLGSVVSVASLTVINPNNINGTSPNSLKNMIDLFYDSYINDYFYEKYDSTAGFSTDPFVWLNWGNLRYFGCTMSSCGPPDINDNWPNHTAYADGGVLMNCLLYKSYEDNEYPWKNGTACSDCDSDKTVCNNGLCGNCMTSDWYVNGDSSTQKGDKCSNLGDDFKVYTNSPTSAPTEMHREYTLVPKQMTWSDANKYCQNMGTHLATVITDGDYQQAVHVQSTSGNGLDVWIGLVQINGTWTWSGGNSCDYTTDGNCLSDVNWGPDEPNNVLQSNGAYEDCAHIFGASWTDKDNTYNDAECDLKMYFLCDCVQQLDGSYYCPTGTPTAEPTPAPTVFEIPRKYIYVNKQLTWPEAEDYCQTRYKTTLATVVTDLDHVEAVKMQHSYNGYGSDVWIGLNEIDNPGTWSWADGITCNYTSDNSCASDKHWATGEPNGYWERCVAMFGDWWQENNNYYNDYDCTKEFSFLCNCEKQSNGSYVCPTATPTTEPTSEPTYNPTQITSHPTHIPTNVPTKEPTMYPTTNKPTIQPTNIPTSNPTYNPTIDPTTIPSIYPTYIPTINPTIYPTSHPSVYPTINPTILPTINPTIKPTINPTFLPTFQPTDKPTSIPSNYPTSDPTNTPTTIPSNDPTTSPTINPSLFPTINPSIQPSNVPTIDPTVQPTEYPTNYPTNNPTANPTIYPTSQPTKYPTKYPTDIETSIVNNDIVVDGLVNDNANNDGIHIAVSTKISALQLLIILLVAICLICCVCLICVIYIRHWKQKAMEKYQNNIVNMAVVQNNSPTSPKSTVTPNKTPVSVGSVGSVGNILDEMNEGDVETQNVTVLNSPNEVIGRQSTQLQSIFNDIMEMDTANNMNVTNQLENIEYDKSSQNADCALNMIVENSDEKSSDEVVINVKEHNICNDNKYNDTSHVVMPSNQQRPSMLDKLI